MPAAGGNGTVNVTTSAGCAWTVDNAPSWAHVTSGASGNGPGGVQFAVDPNTGSGRTATILIATQPFVLTQDSACTFVVSPDTLARGNVASTERLDVTAPGGMRVDGGEQRSVGDDYERRDRIRQAGRSMPRWPPTPGRRAPAR